MKLTKKKMGIEENSCLQVYNSVLDIVLPISTNLANYPSTHPFSSFHEVCQMQPQLPAFLFWRTGKQKFYVQLVLSLKTNISLD